jgi:hypothetical protein
MRAMACLLAGTVLATAGGPWWSSCAGAGAAQAAYAIPDELKFWSAMMRQTVLSASKASFSVSYSCPGTQLVLRLQEENPTTLEWERSRHTYSTSYAITSVTAREGGLARIPHQALSEIAVDAVQLGVWRPRAPEAALNRPLRSPTEPNAEMGRSCGDCAEAW